MIFSLHAGLCTNFLLILSLQYNDYVHFIEPCFKGILVQADRDNREVSTRLSLMLSRQGISLNVRMGLRCCNTKL